MSWSGLIIAQMVPAEFRKQQKHWSQIYVAMELAPNGNLLDYISSHGAIPEEKSRKMFQQLVDVMDYLHGKHIVHRSLSCENLLLDLHYNIKVSDFSFARHFNDSELSKTFCGSAAYMPPEVLQGNAYEMPGHDVWGMGVILYVMLTGLMPFDDSDMQKQIDAQLKGTTPDRKHVKISVAASDLIRNMLEPVVEERYTLRMIKAHQWLQGITMTQADTKHFRKKTCCIIL